MYVADSQAHHDQGQREEYAEIHIPWEKLEQRLRGDPNGSVDLLMAAPVHKPFLGYKAGSIEYAEAFDYSLEQVLKDPTATQTVVRITCLSTNSQLQHSDSVHTIIPPHEPSAPEPGALLPMPMSGSSLPWDEQMVWKLFRACPLDDTGRITMVDLREFLAQRHDTQEAFGCKADEVFSYGSDDRLINWAEFVARWRIFQRPLSPLASMRSTSPLPVQTLHSPLASMHSLSPLASVGSISPVPVPTAYAYGAPVTGSSTRIIRPPVQGGSFSSPPMYSLGSISPPHSGYATSVRHASPPVTGGFASPPVTGGSVAFPERIIEFEVVLDKSDGKMIGLDVDPQNEFSLVVMSVGEDPDDPGLVQQWNSLHPDKAVQKGDKIVQVNGVRGNVFELRAECKKNEVLTLKLQRRSMAPVSPRYSVHSSITSLTRSTAPMPSAPFAYKAPLLTSQTMVPRATTSPVVTYARSPSPMASYRAGSPVATYGAPRFSFRAPPWGGTDDDWEEDEEEEKEAVLDVTLGATSTPMWTYAGPTPPTSSAVLPALPAVTYTRTAVLNPFPMTSYVAPASGQVVVR
eukprot:gnl/TRDRNA2_/TRDRNA2_154362_c0_seq1.p1 gnl/TRDRNA2_/TRDRNA2_154362_c0~~gnl/TRDRNA2_/TRDRNA2_154362_c0_seq1.p1  ORF type:complete len:573 (+),score=65.58 gnl/TRDRNA2_/TRDRNA2_154362_c0_seq1:25-1743(+)